MVWIKNTNNMRISMRRLRKAPPRAARVRLETTAKNLFRNLPPQKRRSLLNRENGLTRIPRWSAVRTRREDGLNQLQNSREILKPKSETERPTQLAIGIAERRPPGGPKTAEMFPSYGSKSALALELFRFFYAP